LPISLAVLAVTTMALSPAHALQVLEARDGVAAEAILSIKEATRIRIEGAPITDVFGSIHSSNCGGGLPASPGAVVAPPALNPGGEIVLECDRDKGEIYIRPVGDSAKPVNLFIASARATYTLVLRRSDTPADTIIIRDRSLPKAPLQPINPLEPMGPLGPSAHHVRAMKAMLVAMASGRMLADIRVDEINQPMQLWSETKFALLRRYEGRGLVGETYLLQNLGAAAMVLAEAEFDREGVQVVGVAIEQHHLRPGESTNVFVIRRGDDR
jgi:conjugal transfer pilus assembly protein TraK